MFAKIYSHMGTETWFVDLGHMGPKCFSDHNLATTCQTFSNNPSFYSKFYDKHLTTF